MARRVRNRVDLFDEVAPGADTNIPGATVVVAGSGQSNIRLAYRVQFANDTTFKAVVSRAGEGDQAIGFNGGSVLKGGQGYEFEVTAKPGEAWNHQIGTDGAIAVLTIDQIEEGSDA